MPSPRPWHDRPAAPAPTGSTPRFIPGRQSRQPTWGVAVAFAAGGGLQAWGRHSSQPWVLFGSALLLVLPIVATLLAADLRGLRLTWSWGRRAAAGEQVPFTLVLRNGGSRTSPPLRVVHRLPGFTNVVVAFPALRPGEQSSLVVRRTAVRRGVATGGTVTWRAVSPIGLVQTRMSLAIPDRVPIHPAKIDHRQQAEGDGPFTTASRPKRRAGVGDEVIGLREWRQGESVRAISARATARHGRPLVLEREQESFPRCTVLVGGGRHVPDRERQLSVAAAFVVDVVAQGGTPLLRGLPQLPVGQRRSVQAMLDAFAAADAAPALTAQGLHDALLETAPGGLLMIVPGAVAVHQLAPGLRAAARSRRVRLVVLDPPSGPPLTWGVDATDG